MIDLSAYISHFMSVHQEYSDSMKKKMNAMRSSVDVFLGGESVDLTALIDPAFVLRLGRFLFDGTYASVQSSTGKRGNYSNISGLTLTSHLARLRTVLHEAVAKGLLPAVDVFPTVSVQLKEEFSISDEDIKPLLGTDNTKFARLATHKFRFEIDKMSANMLTGLNSVAKVKKAVPMLFYLAGLLAYGLEVEELLEVKWNSESERSADDIITIAHPRMGCLIQIPERALRIVDILNQGGQKDGYLISRRKEWAGKDMAEVVAEIREGIRTQTRLSGVSLFNNGNIYADWLCLMKEAGLDDATVCALAQNNILASDVDKVVKVGGNLLCSHLLFRKQWHVLCSYDRKLNSTEMRRKVSIFLKEHKIPFDRNRESYDPRSIEKKLVRGKVVKRNSPVISRYLFLYCSDDTARLIDRQSQKASFMRELGQRDKFATASHREIVSMVKFLRDYRDDVQLVDIDVSANCTCFSEGVKVRILSGPFAGFEGTISQVLNLDKKFPNESHANTAGMNCNMYVDDADKRSYEVLVEGFAMTNGAHITVKGLEMVCTEDN